MIRLTITDVGPITKTVEIEFKRFCILIGPQSNGKSTIAKILSTCLWLEKEACTTISDKIVKNGDEFQALLEDFHRMHNYIHPDRSLIRYESDYVEIAYNKGAFTLCFRDNLSYLRRKISYIPSDRNVVTMKDIEKRDLEPTNFRSFLFDWLDANRHYDTDHKIPILNLGVKYYYDENANDRRDILTHENGVSYDISLYDASSGMQSLVPMTVLMHYLVTDYLKNYGNDISFDQKKKYSKLSWTITELITTKHYPEQVAKSDYKSVYTDKIKKLADMDDASALAIIREMIALYERLVYPKNISFILEEPEQNLFPLTQVCLLNNIISLCNSSSPSSVLITTHSPYILAAANILLFADKLKRAGIDPKRIGELINTDEFITQDEFTAYAVSDGTCNSVIDMNTGLISENELDSASDYNSDVFEKMYELYVSKCQAK